MTPITAASSVLISQHFKGAIKENHNGPFNANSSIGQRHDHLISNQQTYLNLGANLPGFISSFKFPSFPSLVWPDMTYLSLFKAHGPAPQIQLVSSFGDFSFFQPQVAEHSLHLASSASLSLSLHRKNPPPNSAPRSPGSSPAAMVNIPIDPQPFVSHGFEIQHIEGRVGVKRVVVARKPRLHEQYAIATIAPFPQGQVHFGNVRVVLEEY
jgi:hypothetical protein